MNSLRIQLLLIANFFILQSGADAIGINYGLLGNNLPPPDRVISLLRSRNVKQIHIYDPNDAVLNALRDTDIEVILGTRNEDLQALATSPQAATSWVNQHVLPYAPSVNFRYISAGNEVVPGPYGNFVLAAMQNLESALHVAGLKIPVSTTVSLQVLGTSYPPSAGDFIGSSKGVMVPIVDYLHEQNSPLLVTVYPYFAYIGNRAKISLQYALLDGVPGGGVVDGSLVYTNLFDAMVDAVYSAIERVGGRDVDIVVSETGWPSGGGDPEIDNVLNAQTYINNVVRHVESGVGTPKRPGKALETYLFALFNENQKPPGTEQNFGLYHPDMTEVYHVDLRQLVSSDSVGSYSIVLSGMLCLLVSSILSVK